MQGAREASAAAAAVAGGGGGGVAGLVSSIASTLAQRSAALRGYMDGSGGAAAAAARLGQDAAPPQSTRERPRNSFAMSAQGACQSRRVKRPPTLHSGRFMSCDL